MGIHLNRFNIRSNHLLLTVHKLLIKVLEFALKLHDACKTKNNFNIGLAEVITDNLYNFSKQRNIQLPHYKKHFYDPTGALRKSVNINKLDITVLAILLRTSFIISPEPSKSTNSLEQQCSCCPKCKHDKCFCGVKVNSCVNKANCGYTVCSSSSCPLSTTWKCSIECKHKECTQGTNLAISDDPNCVGDPLNCKKMGCPCESSPKCQFIAVKRFVEVAAFFRNSHSHATLAVYSSLDDGNPAFENFPLSKSWENIWEVVNKASLDCLTVLKSNGGFIDIEVYKDYEMKLRISLKEDVKHLIEVVSKDFQRLSDAIMTEESKISKDLKDLRREMNKGISLQLSSTKNN